MKRQSHSSSPDNAAIRHEVALPCAPRLGCPAGVRQNLSAKLADAPDFWSKVGAVELQLYERLDRRAPAAELAELGPEYEDLQRRVAASLMWRSVYDQARFLLAGFVGSNKLDEAQLRALHALCEQLAVYAGVEG